MSDSGRLSGRISPLSFAQERLWFVDAAAPGGSAYNVPLFMWWRETVDVAALRTALNAVVRRHEILRTTYQLRDGNPVQVVSDAVPDLVEVVEGVPRDEVLSDAHRRAAEPFDLAAGPMLRCVVWPDADAVLLAVHHIAVDGWSMSALFSQLAQAYRGGELEDPAIQYGDFAVWDREKFAQDDVIRRADELKAIPGDLALAGRRKPVTAGERPGAVHHFALTVDVEGLARRLRATPFVVLFAAFQAVLRRWTERDEFLVGVVMANRTHPAADDLIGFFVNTVPLRCAVRSGSTFRDLCGEVRAESYRALTYQKIPFEQLTAATRQQGNLATVAFVLQNTSAPEYQGDPPWTQPVELHTGTAMYELTLQVEDGLAATLEYDTECYDAEMIATFAENFTTLLAAAVEDPDRLVAELPITEQGPSVLAGPEEQVPGAPATVLDLLENGGAVEYDGTQVSWPELDNWAWAVANALPELEYVPVIAARSAAAVVGWLGALRAGAAYVPLSTDAPPHRVEYVLRDIGATVVLADEEGAKVLDNLGADMKIVRIDELRAVEGKPTKVAVDGESPAIVLYTSGTTGRPKGVVIPHRGLLNASWWWAREVGLGPGDRFLNTSSTQFDAGNFDSFSTLLSGTTLVFAGDVERRDPRALLNHIRGPRGVAVLDTTPSLLHAMLAADELSEPTTLRVVTLGGEALPPQLAVECANRWGVRVQNTYGPTEVSCVSTAAWVGDRVTIGRPIPNIKACILGPEQEELPPGVPGELYLAGVGVGLGYLNDPERTAQAFVPDRFGETIMYRTGDRVVLAKDGQLEFLGRFDDQVKILGNRIEPGEVRRLIEDHPAVRAAAVLAEGQPRRLVAYVELADVDKLPTRDEILRPLLDWLPPPAIPADVFVIDRMPLTGNDKMDLAALDKIHRTRLPDAELPRVPLTEHEQRAAELVSHHVPGAGNLSAEANFFAVGGHSLLAVSMIAEAERRWGIAVPLRDFLADPTVAGLGRLLAHAQPVAAQRSNVNSRMPATAVQQRLWFVDRIRQQRNAYLLPVVVELSGPVDRDRLCRAVDETLARHPALRSRFELDHKSRQVFYDTAGPPATARIVAEADEKYVEDVCWTPFNLAEDAPARAEIIPAGKKTLLVLVSHHIVFDGWSLDLVLSEIAARYQSKTDSLPRAVHPAEVVQRTASAEEMIERLRGAPTDVALPRDRPRPELQTSNGAMQISVLPEDISSPLRAFASELGCSTFVTAAALLAATLARVSAQRDFLFAIPWSGRDAAGSADAVGMFVNILVLRVDLRTGPSWRELFAAVLAESKACYRNADVPFDALVAKLHPERDLSRPPLTPVYVGAFDGPAGPPDFGAGVTARFRPCSRVNVKYELDFVVMDRGTELEFTASYATDLFDAATVARLLDGVRACAQDLVANPDAAVLKGGHDD
ncbi:non-ribosomal peptide synthetase [Kibdelosporangium aridum]|uniref:non-ribosomal peptide synthetase n=1 Tax=Kibdelosporangium aridum TaxID=2030 RepID=UPI00135C0BEF|nr:non-ribosomal peptide synthetase [Kibdelosporangium aridum]